MNGQDALFCGGFAALLFGVGQIYVPAAFIVGGGLVVILCVVERLRG